MELKNFEFALNLELLQSDEKSYDRTFFDTLSAIKEELGRVEQSLMPYHELSPSEYKEAEDHYDAMIDALNKLDMEIRVEHQKLTRS